MDVMDYTYMTQVLNLKKETLKKLRKETKYNT